MGSPRYALAVVGEKIRRTQGYKSMVVMFTAGFASLHECFPRAGLQWMKSGNAAARRYVPEYISWTYEVKVHRCVDCMALESDRARRPRGHLGFHPQNLGLFLGESNKAWRTQRYVEIYALMLSTAMVDDSESLGIVTFCRQGKHRSVGWMCLEACLWAAMGFDVKYTNVCKWLQQMERCQWRGREVDASTMPGCPECGTVSEDTYAQPPEDLADAVIFDFFETVLSLENQLAFIA